MGLKLFAGDIIKHYEKAQSKLLCQYCVYIAMLKSDAIANWKKEKSFFFLSFNLEKELTFQKKQELFKQCSKIRAAKSMYEFKKATLKTLYFKSKSVLLSVEEEEIFSDKTKANSNYWIEIDSSIESDLVKILAK